MFQYFIVAELEEFLQYTIGLEFDTEPDYDWVRNLFKGALKKRKYPLDGKIDFTTPKSPVKKVRKPMAPKRANSARSSSSTSDSPTPAKVPAKKTAAAAAKSSGKKTAAVKAKPKTKAEKRLLAEEEESSSSSSIESVSVGCQTSPAFVKAAKAAKRAKKANPELEEFTEMAISSAKKAATRQQRGTPKAAKKSPAAAKRRSGSTSRSRSCGGDDGVDDVFANPTPAMKALLEKKAAKEAEKNNKRKTSRAKK